MILLRTSICDEHMYNKTLKELAVVCGTPKLVQRLNDGLQYIYIYIYN